MTAPLPPVPPDPLRDEIAARARAEGWTERYRSVDREPRFPREEFRALGTAGWLGLSVPVDWGGRGLPLARVVGALFEMARHGGTMYAKLALQPEFSILLARTGSAELRREYFEPMVRGELLIGNHITEPGAGSDAAALGCRAERRGERYVITGTKSQAAFSEDADAAIVLARTGGAAGRGEGITAFLVPQRIEGIRRRVVADLGERWMRRGTVEYDAVEVPLSHRLGAEGSAFALLKEELTHERALLGAVYLGTAWTSFADTVEYVGSREAFGRPLSLQEAVSFPLVEDEARLSAAWGYLERVVAQMERGERCEAEAALSKWFAGQVALEAAEHALHFHGGAGYSEEWPFAQRFRDLQSARVAHGTDEVMHLVAARELWPRPKS